MILVDTSVWIDHFRSGNIKLQNLLQSGLVCTHQFVMGELLLGHFKKQTNFQIQELLENIQCLPMLPHSEVKKFVLQNKLTGKGIGWIDAHLLFSAVESKVRLFTLDKKLEFLASHLI